jgi:ubiquinone biosynthesis protein COQ9
MSNPADWASRAEGRLLDAALPLVGELGWTSRLVAAAARAAGLSPAEAELLLPQGARDLAALLSHRHDEAALDALAPIDPAPLKVRERIARGVEARVAAAMRDEAATRRWMGFLALPQNLVLGGRLFWASADALWRWAGDTATDQNHYSKRAILAGLLSSALAVRLSSSPAAASEHIQRGIEAVMAYEKLKARFAEGDILERAAQILGKMRYGAAEPAAQGEPPAG